MLIVDMSQRPAIREWTSRPATSSDSAVNRCARSSPRPMVLPSIIPETDNDSATSAEMLARPIWRRPVIARRSRPTRRVIHTNSGKRPSEIAASCQLSSAIAIVVAMTVVAFCAIVVAVLVATLSIPPMSLAIRDWTSPARVRVKNAIDILWRWRYTATRRSCITRWPTSVET